MLSDLIFDRVQVLGDQHALAGTAGVSRDFHAEAGCQLRFSIFPSSSSLGYAMDFACGLIRPQSGSTSICAHSGFSGTRAQVYAPGV
jgi:hypothetical protein